MPCEQIVILWTIFAVLWIELQLPLQWALTTLKLTLVLLPRLFEQLRHIHFVCFKWRVFQQIGLIKWVCNRLHIAVQHINTSFVKEARLLLFLLLYVCSLNLVTTTFITVLTSVVLVEVRVLSSINSLSFIFFVKTLRDSLIWINNNNFCRITWKVWFKSLGPLLVDVLKRLIFENLSPLTLSEVLLLSHNSMNFRIILKFLLFELISEFCRALYHHWGPLHLWLIDPLTIILW